MESFILKQAHLNRKENHKIICSWCGEPIKLGMEVVKTSTKYYHKNCYLQLLH